MKDGKYKKIGHENVAKHVNEDEYNKLCMRKKINMRRNMNMEVVLVK